MADLWQSRIFETCGSMCSVVHEGSGDAGHAGGKSDPSKPLSGALSIGGGLTRRGSVSIGISGVKEISKTAASALAKQVASPSKPGFALDLPDDMGPPGNRMTPRLARRGSLLGKSGFGQAPAVNEEDLDANPLGGLSPIRATASQEQGLELGEVSIRPLTTLDEVIAWRQQLMSGQLVQT